MSDGYSEQLKRQQRDCTFSNRASSAFGWGSTWCFTEAKDCSCVLNECLGLLVIVYRMCHTGRIAPNFGATVPKSEAEASVRRKLSLCDQPFVRHGLTHGWERTQTLFSMLLYGSDMFFVHRVVEQSLHDHAGYQGTNTSWLSFILQ